MEKTKETQVQSLGQEDTLEEEMATHSSILPWRILWTEDPGGLVHGVAKSRTQLSHFTFTFSNLPAVMTQIPPLVTSNSIATLLSD